MKMLTGKEESSKCGRGEIVPARKLSGTRIEKA
jgi:hypothetical protein